MANYGGFYKGDKKKPKKEVFERKALKIESNQPSFTLPEIIPKGKTKNE